MIGNRDVLVAQPTACLNHRFDRVPAVAEVRVHVEVNIDQSSRREPLLDRFHPPAVVAYAREHLADFKVPQFVAVRNDPLPRNPNGKVLKAQLRQTDFGAPLFP